MSDGRVQSWLEKKLAREARENLILAFVILIGAAAVLAVTFALFYTFSFFVFWRVFRFHLALLWWVTFGGVVLLFIANRFSDREELTTLEVESMDGGPVQTFYLPQVGMVSNLNPFSPTNARTGVKIIADLLLTGPRLVAAAWETFKRSGRLRTMDVPVLAEVFAKLISAGKRVSLAEILLQLGHCDPSLVFRQLREIEGVVFLNTPPAGISLTAELREEIFEELKGSN
jgi:hypothetical protein